MDYPDKLKKIKLLVAVLDKATKEDTCGTAVDCKAIRFELMRLKRSLAKSKKEWERKNTEGANDDIS